VLARARDAEQPLATLLISEGVATPAVVVSTLAQLAQLPSADLESDPPAQQALDGAARHRTGLWRGRSSVIRAPPDSGVREHPTREPSSAVSHTLLRVMPVLADPTVIARLLLPTLRL